MSTSAAQIVMCLFLSLTSSICQARNWTDRKGRQLEAEQVGFAEGKVKIRRSSDGKVFEVPLKNLSDVDQAFVRSQIKSPDDKLKQFPIQPSSVTFPEKVTARLKDAAEVFNKDEVTAAAFLVEMLDDEKEELSPPARNWLETAYRSVEASAQQSLKHDFEVAIQDGDLRAAAVCVAARSNLKTDAPAQISTLLENSAEFGKLLQKSLSDAASTKLTWEISTADAKIKPSHTDFYGLNKKTFSPKEGFKLIQVTAKAKNVSQESDPSYIGCALNLPRRLLFRMDRESEIEKGKQVKQPCRLAGDTFLYLLTFENKMIPCEHVIKDCRVLQGDMGWTMDLLLSISKTDKPLNMVYPGSFVEPNKEFEVDVLFHVPDVDVKRGLRLYLLASKPFSLTLDSE